MNYTLFVIALIIPPGSAPWKPGNAHGDYHDQKTKDCGF